MPRSRFLNLAEPKGPELDAPWLVVTAAAYAAVVLVTTYICAFSEADPLPPVLAAYVASSAAYAWRAARPWVRGAMLHAGAAVLAATGIITVVGTVVDQLGLGCAATAGGLEFAKLWSSGETYEQVFAMYFAPVLLAAVLAPVIGWPARLARDAWRRRAVRRPAAPAGRGGERAVPTG
jgi:hypothetical protein